MKEQGLITRVLEYAQKNREGDIKEEITDYGNGVLYFMANKGHKHFGKTLSGYLSVHPNIQIISITAHDGNEYGSTTGYFVIVKEGVK